MRNFKDESFIAQYLSPRLIREFRLFVVADHVGKAELEVDSIHDEHGYRRVRRMLADQYKRENMLPEIQVTRYERDGDRSLTAAQSDLSRASAGRRRGQRSAAPSRPVVGLPGAPRGGGFRQQG